MPFVVACPNCGVKMKAEDEAVGKKLPCPECGQSFTVTAPGRDTGTLDVLPAAGPGPQHPRPPAPPVSRRPVPPPDVAPRDRWQQRPRARGGIPCVLWAVGIPTLLVVVCCGGLVFLGWLQGAQQKQDIERADQLWADGKQEEATDVYKKYPQFLLQPENQGVDALRRVVEFEVSQGHKEEARKWMRDALNKKLTVTYNSPAAKELVAEVEKERAADTSTQKTTVADRSTAPVTTTKKEGVEREGRP